MKRIKILGTGCAKCEMLTRHTHEAANALGIDYELSKVTDLAEIMSFGVMTTPALVVDGKVIVSGRVPTAEAIKAMLAH